MPVIRLSVYSCVWQTFERLYFRVYADRFILVGVKQFTILVVRAYAFPSALLSRVHQVSREMIIVVDDEDEFFIAELELFRFPSGSFDFHLPAESAAEIPKNLSIIAFVTNFEQTQEAGYVFHVPFDLMKSNGLLAQVKINVQRFTLSPKASAIFDMVSVGETGRRAVWLQRRWDTDEFELMKASFSTESATLPQVGALVPASLALPLGSLHTCRSLAFDEAMGSVLICLHTGELYILQF